MAIGNVSLMLNKLSVYYIITVAIVFFTYIHVYNFIPFVSDNNKNKMKIDVENIQEWYRISTGIIQKIYMNNTENSPRVSTDCAC